MLDWQACADGLLKTVGGASNISSLENCMTRVRITVKNDSIVSEAKIKAVPGVLGLIRMGNNFQVVIGPGNAAKVKNFMVEIDPSLKALGPAQTPSSSTPTNNGSYDVDSLKTETKKKFNNKIGNALKVFSNIFVPLIPGFIGSGLLTGIVNMLKSPAIGGTIAENHPNIIGLLAIFASSIFLYMNILVGVNAAKEFGGSIAIGGIIAGIISHPSLASITLFGSALVPGRGGIFAVLLAVFFASWLENFIRKYVPGIVDLLLTPLLTLLIAGFATIFILQPIGGFLADGITHGVVGLIDKGGPITGFILAGTFLPLVLFGIHQGLTPIHAQLLQEGANTFLPILAMAGAGQVGAALAVFVKTKDPLMKKTVLNALPVGLMGVGEPLIYGVTLPLFKPFIGACIGAAFGGAVIATFKVGVTSMGISGLVLVAATVHSQIGFYLLGLLTSYIFGFIATYLLGFKDLNAA